MMSSICLMAFRRPVCVLWLSRVVSCCALAALDLLLEVVHPLLVITPALKIDGVLPALIVLILILDLVFLVREFRVQTVELRRQVATSRSRRSFSA